MLDGLNWPAAFAAAASSLLVGFVWYNPKVFGSIWMREIGMSMEDARAKTGFNPQKMFGGTFLLSLIAAIAMNMLVLHGRETPQFDSFKHGVFHGVEIAFFIVLPVVATSSIYEMRGWRYVAIVVGFWVVSLGLMGGILNVWH